MSTRSLNLRGNPNWVFGDLRSDEGGRPLGTRMHLSDGRVFRWGKAQAEAIAIGRIVQAGAANDDLVDLAPNSAHLKGDQKLTLTIVQSKEIIEVNRYADGLVYVNDADGEGHVYTIGAQEGVVNGATSIVLHLDGALNTNLTTSSGCTLVRSRFNGIVIADTQPKDQIVGVAPRAITGSYYSWFQTGGACAILQDGELFKARPVTHSEKVGGACRTLMNVVPAALYETPSQRVETEFGHEVVSYGNERAVDVNSFNERLSRVSGIGIIPKVTVGYALDPRADTEYGLVNLTLDN